MSTIYTLTGNLLAERTLEFAAWHVGGTHRAARESFQVGGKGFNVAKMLHRLEEPVVALGFAGGVAGDECRQWLAAHAGYQFHLFEQIEPTRTGVVVRGPDQPETTFLAPDRSPDAAALRGCAEFLDTLPPAATLALCGSFPGWARPEAQPLREAIFRRAHLPGGLAVDTYGPPLADLVTQPLRLVKINRSEFDGLGAADDSRPLDDRLREALGRWPVQEWVITDGPHPVRYATSAGLGAVFPPTITEISATGSGDVMFAVLLHVRLRLRRPLLDALVIAVPCAAANAASLGVADFPWPPESGNLQRV